MVMTFVLIPQSHYNTITEPRANFLLSLMEDLSMDFLSHMIVSIIDCYRDTATRDKLIFPSAITRILTHLHVTIPSFPLFHVMGAISKESIRKSATQLATKRPHVETKDVAPTPRPSSTSTPSFSSRVNVSYPNIMDQLQHIRADFGSRFNHLSDEMCQMNTRISRIARRQSCLGGFAPSPSPEPTEKSSFGGDNDDDANGSSFSSDDEMMTSQ